MRRLVSAIAVASSMLASGSPAAAAMITRTYAFAFRDFTPFTAGAPAPVDPFTGSFTVTFDPAVAIYDATAGLTVHAINLPVTGSFAFSYTPFGTLTLGAITSPGDQVAAFGFGISDFFLGFFHPLTVPIAPYAAYSQAGINNAWFSGSGVVGAHDGVPEPSAWAFLLCGFMGLGARMRTTRMKPC